MKKILVALDDSSSSAEVFKQALTIARAIEAQLMILQVLEDIPVAQVKVGGNVAIDKPSTPIEQKVDLQAYINQAKLVGVEAEMTQSHGTPSQVICDWAWAWHADLIVIGRRGQTTISDWILGSVSTYVSQHSPCSVLLVATAKQPGVSPESDRTTVVA